MRGTAAVVALLVATVPLAGCLGGLGVDARPVREIDMWVEQRTQELHPGANETVWAFCAEGDGVEPVHGEDPCGVPGPTIRVTEGDRVRLTFENTHTVPHTVHFHGWHAFEADMNGAEIVDDAMVVDPGEEATIEWIAEPSGSFIYHCHFETPTHMDMGMYGAFIVEERRVGPEDTPDVDRAMVLDEWRTGEAGFSGADPDYDLFTIDGKSFPLTEPIVAEPGDHVRLHLVNAGFEFRAMHLHGYTPDSWEGVAGPEHAVPTDVREVAPGQTVVLDFTADREGVWLFHDHVVPHVTAGADGDGFGAYPRGMLTVLAVGEGYAQALQAAAPELLERARGDLDESADGAHADHGHDDEAASADDPVVAMQDIAFQPERIEVQPGTTVRWENRDSVVHTVTAEDGAFDSGDVDPGETYERTFDEPGRYPYYCTPHASQDDEGDWQGMTGTVVVREGTG